LESIVTFDYTGLLTLSELEQVRRGIRKVVEKLRLARKSGSGKLYGPCAVKFDNPEANQLSSLDQMLSPRINIVF
jgi:hypothetical protein